MHSDYCLRKKANFEAILKPIEGNGEGSLLLKEFMSKASHIHVSNDLIQVAKKNFLFHLEWKDMIKRLASIDDNEYGRVKDAWLGIYDPCTKNHAVFEEVYWRLC